MRKGIILSGGVGSRLFPLTKTISKQLLPVYDKPLVYYSLATLMKAEIREVLIIVSNMMNQMLFADLLGTGQNLGMKIDYRIQKKPNGIAEAFLVAEDWIGDDNVILILGDNVFYGRELDNMLPTFGNSNKAEIFGCKVKDPSRYGVAVVEKGAVITEPSDIVEKPKEFISDLAVPGLYAYPSDVAKRASYLKPSDRGELEITDLTRKYIDDELCSITVLKDTFWFDAGTYDSLLEASQFVQTVCASHTKTYRTKYCRLRKNCKK